VEFLAASPEGGWISGSRGFGWRIHCGVYKGVATMPVATARLQAADERLERDAGARTLDHRTKAATRLRWHSRRHPSSRSGPPSARRSPSSVRRVGRLQGIWAEDLRQAGRHAEGLSK
jgi:hypothetical protein